MREEVTVTDLPVTGTIPERLDGRYVRNGPNPIAPDPALYNWFVGHGMVHGVRIRGGRVEWYRKLCNPGRNPFALGLQPRIRRPELGTRHRVDALAQ